MDARKTIYDFLTLPSSQRRFIAERYDAFVPGELEHERSKRVVAAVVAQGKQTEFAELVDAAKSN